MSQEMLKNRRVFQKEEACQKVINVSKLYLHYIRKKTTKVKPRPGTASQKDFIGQVLTPLLAGAKTFSLWRGRGASEPPSYLKKNYAT